MDVLDFLTARALDLNGSGGRRFNVKQALMAYRTIDYMIHEYPSFDNESNICSGYKISNFLDYVNTRIEKHIVNYDGKIYNRGTLIKVLVICKKQTSDNQLGKTKTDKY